jgi:hypothetical protein
MLTIALAAAECAWVLNESRNVMRTMWSGGGLEMAQKPNRPLLASYTRHWFTAVFHFAPLIPESRFAGK